MKTNYQLSSAGYPLLFVALWILAASRGPASTVAYWRFEEGPVDAQVTHGGLEPGVFFAGVMDSSGNGNALSVWTEGWAGYAYRVDVPGATIPGTGAANNFSAQTTGSWPCMFTANGTPMQTMSPAAFTIEASFKPETGGWRTLVGRDSQGACAGNPLLAALYFQITPQDAVAIKFCDVSGYWHEAISANGLVTGFTYPDSAAGHWYHMGAVSDGRTVSLYLDLGGGSELVAQTDMTLSGSPNTALTAGMGGGSTWTAGTWSVGRGMYAGSHTDRAYGLIDEVRISDAALSPSDFLWSFPYCVLIPSKLQAPLQSETLVTLQIPTACNASRAIDVTVVSDNPLVAKPAGSAGSVVLSFPAGASPRSPLSIEFGTAGVAHFNLSSTWGCPVCPGAALTVYVRPLPPELRTTLTATNTVVVWWPTSTASWRLQAATNLTAGSTWTDCSYETNGATCSHLVTSPSGSRLYRLCWP